MVDDSKIPPTEEPARGKPEWVLLFVERDEWSVARCGRCFFSPPYGGCLAPAELYCDKRDREDRKTGYFTAERIEDAADAGTD